MRIPIYDNHDIVVAGPFRIMVSNGITTLGIIAVSQDVGTFPLVPLKTFKKQLKNLSYGIFTRGSEIVHHLVSNHFDITIWHDGCDNGDELSFEYLSRYSDLWIKGSINLRKCELIINNKMFVLNNEQWVEKL